LAQANEIAVLEGGPLDLPAVQEDPVRAARVAHGQARGPGFDHGVPPRALGVVQDHVAGGIATQGDEGPGEFDRMSGAGRVSNLEFHDGGARRFTDYLVLTCGILAATGPLAAGASLRAAGSTSVGSAGSIARDRRDATRERPCSLRTRSGERRSWRS